MVVYSMNGMVMVVYSTSARVCLLTSPLRFFCLAKHARTVKNRKSRKQGSKLKSKEERAREVACAAQEHRKLKGGARDHAASQRLKPLGP